MIVLPPRFQPVVSTVFGLRGVLCPRFCPSVHLWVCRTITTNTGQNVPCWSFSLCHPALFSSMSQNTVKNAEMPKSVFSSAGVPADLESPVIVWEFS